MWKGARGWGPEGWGKGSGVMGVGRVVGKGVGRGFNQSFEQNRYSYIEFCYRNAHYETKSAKNHDFEGVPPFFGRESPYYDIIISQKHHVLTPKSPKTRCAGDFT